MWLSEKTASRDERESCCAVGTVTSAGKSPVTDTGGAVRAAKLLGPSCYVPRADDELLTIECADGERFALGLAARLPEDAENGEIVISNGTQGLIRIRADGSVELSGSIKLTGTVEIEGGLTVNGEAYVSPGSGESESGGEDDGA